MRRSSVEGYGIFRWLARLVTRHYRLIVLLWILIFAGALLANQVWNVNDVVSYSQTELLPNDTESAKAQTIVDAEFPGTLANATATVVVVGNDTTTGAYRSLVLDLNDAIVRSANLSEGATVTMTLRNGDSLTLSHPIQFLADPGNATVYAVFESYAYRLAEEFAVPVRLQVQFAQSAGGIYWGLPQYFVTVWAQTPEPGANATAQAATESYVNASLPAELRPWALAYLRAFSQGWMASFGAPLPVPPLGRAAVVTNETVPSFVASNPSFDGAQRSFQLGMIPVFGFANYTNATLVEEYAIEPFLPAGVAKAAFFLDLYREVPTNATTDQLRTYAEQEVLAYDILDTPLTPPLNVTRYYISPDRGIQLLNYAFTKDPRYLDAQRHQPIANDVETIRSLVADLKSSYGLAGEVYVTGSAPISLDQQRIFVGGAEFLVTVILVLVLLGLYFRSAVAPAFPLLTIAIALFVANLFVYFVAVYFLNIDFTVTAILQTVILATGVDYSIFLVSRYRDERQAGKAHKDAVRHAVIWAGESVATSGGAVLISFAALSLGSFPLMRTLGLTLGFAVTMALGISLTFIPAAMTLLGPRIFWPSGKRVTRPLLRGELTLNQRYFRRAAKFSMRHAKAILIVSILLTIPATYVVLTDIPTYDFSQGTPATESTLGIDAIGQSFGYGFVYPSYIVVQMPSPILLPDGNVSVPAMMAIDRLSTRILSMEKEVKSLEGPTNPQGSPIDYRNLSSMPEAKRALLLTTIRPYLGSDNRTARITLVFADTPFSLTAINAVDRLRTDIAEIQTTNPLLQGSTVYLGGVTPVLNDVRSNTNRDLQLMALVVIAGLFTVLLFVMGSVLIPVRAILTILLSISWTLALTIVLFHVWRGLDVIFILPLALFVMAMGLGMDYDIFVVTRVREEVARGATDPDAIAEATTRTGGIISACGVVMAGAFATLMLNPSPFLQEIGFALAFVVLLDSMVVRIYLVPAILVLAGRRNWWAPGGLQRVRIAEKARPSGTRMAGTRARRSAWALFLLVGVPLGLMAALGALARARIYVDLLRPLWQPWPPDSVKLLIGLAGFSATLAYLAYVLARTARKASVADPPGKHDT